MKRIHKSLIGAGFAFTISLFALSACKEYQYVQKIPKKYLLDGNYATSNDYFDFYTITTEGDYQGKYAVSLKDGVSQRSLTIPDYYNGTAVVGIYRNGFSNLTNLSITIPSSIQVIDYEAFMKTEFTNTSFSIPYTVEKLGTASFFGTNIQSLIFSDGTTQIEGVCQATSNDSATETKTTVSKITEIPDFCFANCKSLSNITFSNTLKTISTEAFENCSSLSTVAFLSGLEQISDKAFNNCASLQSVYIPHSLVITQKDLGDFCFAHCNSNLNYYFHSTEDEFKTFNNSHSKFLRQSEYNNNTYKSSFTTGDVFANGSWLYNVQTLPEETEESINLMKYIGNLPKDGTMAFPDKINDKKVTTFEKDCVLDYESQITRMYLPKYLEKIPASFLKVNDKNTSYYTKLTYIGSMSGNNCYKESTETGVFDLSDLSSLHEIGDMAFRLYSGRGNFTKIALPENLKNIGKEAFMGYENVNTFIFTDTGRTFTNGLAIGDSAFDSLGKKTTNSVNKITLPKDTTSIGKSAFECANCITELYIHGSSSATSGENLTILDQAFYNCLYLEKVTIEERGKVTLGSQNGRVFANWSDTGDYLYRPGLQYVYLPKNTTFIGREMFDRQNRLTVYSGDSNLKTSNFGLCFNDAISTTVDGSDTLRHRGISTYFGFECIPNLYSSVKLTKPLGTDSSSFLYEENGFTYVLNPNKKTAILTKYHFDTRKQANETGITLEIPSIINKDYTVTEIGDNAFANDDSYDFTFEGDTNNRKPKPNSETTYRTISKITLPDTIERIGNYAFFRCVGLHQINMPSSLKSIGEHAFSFSGIQELVNLNDDCVLANANDVKKPSPFLNCPNLKSITLNTTGRTSTLIQDTRCLKDKDGNIIVVFPGYTPNTTDKKEAFTFSGTSKFYICAFRGVGWINSLTISSSNFPTYIKDNKEQFYEKGQALFTGFNSEKEIREICCYKGRILADGSNLSNKVELNELRLQLNEKNELSIPEGAMTQTKIKKVIIPYGGGNGTIPSNLLSNIKTDDDSSLIIQVQQDSSTSDKYTNSDNKSGLLDLTNCGYTTIAANAFNGVKALKDVTLDGVINIENNAFNGTGLTKLIVPSSLVNIGPNAFSNTPISTIDFSNASNLTTIGASAFTNTKLSGILEFPSSLQEIGDSAFQNLSGITGISFPDNGFLKSLGANAFQSCNLTGVLKLPNNLSSMGSNVFDNNQNITKVDFSGNESLKVIPASAFDHTKNLSEIIFPKGLTTIERLAFHESGLTSLTIPSSVTSIGDYAFQSCGKLTTLTFEESDSKLTLGDNAFNGCNSLKSLELNRSMDVGNSCFTGCSSLTTLTISDGKMISIKDSAFSGLSSLTTINFGSSLNEIGVSAFSGTGITQADLSKCTNLTSVKGFDNCTKLVTVILPDNCTEIGNSCFSGCSSLSTIKSSLNQKESKVILSDKINNIGNNAFERCVLIQSIRCDSSSLNIGYSAFKGCTGLTQFMQKNGTLSYSTGIFEGCTKLQYIVLPDQFDFNSNNGLVTGLTQFSSDAYICINQTYQSFGATIPAWAKINDTNNAKVAFASFDQSKPSNAYQWTIDGNDVIKVEEAK